MMMIDTHILIWMNIEPQKISPAAHAMLRTAEHVYLSSISIWETALLAKRGRLNISIPCETWLNGICRSPKIRIQEITPDIALKSVDLAMHKDPADRLIVATALCRNLPLITADSKIRDSGLVQTVW